jgi:hypothetical protein
MIKHLILLTTDVALRMLSLFYQRLVHSIQNRAYSNRLRLMVLDGYFTELLVLPEADWPNLILKLIHF